MSEFFCSACESSYRLDIGPIHQYEPTNILCPSCMDEHIVALKCEVEGLHLQCAAFVENEIKLHNDIAALRLEVDVTYKLIMGGGR